MFGHFLERLIGWGNPLNHALLGTIYFVHMPAFIFISGLFYKDQNWLKNIVFFISLYVPFQILFPAFDALWTALTHILIKTKYPVILAIIMALGVGLSPWNNYQYSIGRIFTFFPFFMVGCCYGKRIVALIQGAKRSTLMAVFIIFGIVTLVALSKINPFWLYGSLSYQQLQVSDVDGILIRLGCLLVSSLGILATFSLSRHMGQHGVQLGRNTLAVYLLHGFVVILIARYCSLNVHISIQILLCFIFSLLSCWLLQQNIFDSLLRKLSLWLLKPTEKLWHK